MRHLRKTLVVLPLVVFPLTACSSDSATSAATTISVQVHDVPDSDQWPLAPTPATAVAGKVTFSVKNTGTIQHEMVVLKTHTPFDQLQVDAAGKVGEDASVGEVSEFAAGSTKSVQLDLSAGSYVLVCNIEGHYGKGMRAAFTVT